MSPKLAGACRRYRLAARTLDRREAELLAAIRTEPDFNLSATARELRWTRQRLQNWMRRREG